MVDKYLSLSIESTEHGLLSIIFNYKGVDNLE